MKEICFVVQVPLTERDYDRLGVERFSQRGYRVSFLDLTFFLNREVFEKKIITSMNYEYCCSINSQDDLDKFFAARKAQCWFLIDFTGRSESEVLLEKYLKDSKVIYGILCVNSIPRVRYQPLWQMVFSKKAWQRLRQLLQSKILPSLRKPLPVQFVIAGSLYDERKFPAMNENTKIIWAHTLDYDLFLDYRNHRDKPLIEGDYAVFLDEFFPYHPDFYLKGCPQNPFPSAEEYYDEMNRFFGIIERKLNLKVVIAAHPKSAYENMPSVFEGRTVIKGKTVDLVAHAQCVLCHGSTAVNFAVMFHKSLIFLLPARIKRQFYGRVIAAAANQFAHRPFDLSSIGLLDSQEVFKIDERAYERYKERFIKRRHTPQKPLADIVADVFDRIVNNEIEEQEMRRHEKESINR